MENTMTTNEKLEAIKKAMMGAGDQMAMTETELEIHCILYDKEPTDEEKMWAKRNTEAIEFAEYDDDYEDENDD